MKDKKIHEKLRVMNSEKIKETSVLSQKCSFLKKRLAHCVCQLFLKFKAKGPEFAYTGELVRNIFSIGRGTGIICSRNVL